MTCVPVLNTSPHCSAPSHSSLNTDFNPLHSKISPLTRKKEKEKEKNLILQAAMGRITPPSRLFSSYSLINPTFVFEVTAFKSNRNLEKKKDLSGTGAEWSGAAPILLQTVKKTIIKSWFEENILPRLLCLFIYCSLNYPMPN